MFIIDFMRYMKGSVRFKASGDFAERFVNLAARERIALWDCRRKDGNLHASAPAKSYRKLRGHRQPYSKVVVDEILAK